MKWRRARGAFSPGASLGSSWARTINNSRVVRPWIGVHVVGANVKSRGDLVFRPYVGRRACVVHVHACHDL